MWAGEELLIEVMRKRRVLNGAPIDLDLTTIGPGYVLCSNQAGQPLGQTTNPFVCLIVVTVNYSTPTVCAQLGLHFLAS